MGEAGVFGVVRAGKEKMVAGEYLVMRGLATEVGNNRGFC